MDFSFTDEHDALAGLAGQVFAGEVSVERIKAVEHDGHHDRALWSTLAATGLLGVGVGAGTGGTGGGAIETARILEEQGRTLAPVPLAVHLVASAALDALGAGDDRALLAGSIAGEAVMSVAVDQPPGSTWEEPAVAAARTGDGWRLEGWLPCVASGADASAVLVPARLDGTADTGLFVVDPRAPGVAAEPTVVTSRQPAAHLSLADAPARPLGPLDPSTVRWVFERMMVALSAVALGVAEEALRRAAEYTSQRHQFGQPLSSFQSTAHKAADAYIDVEAMRATLWQAAWLLDEPDADPAEVSAAVLVAHWWATDAGQRVTHAVQHMHGGMGADVDYPVHRFFLWAKQIELTLGSPTAELTRLGSLIADRAVQEAPTR